jgi:NADH:ubiquinone reductase (H+-translocating)
MDATFLPEPAATADPEPTPGVAPRRLSASRPRIVIVGAGFGGLTAAKALAKAPADITVIDRRNYHLFQPLLYQVATAGLSPADIASPIRAVLGRQENTTVLLGKVTGIDTAARDVLIGAQRIPYDYLILATGARHAYFGHEEWANVAPGLKKIEDATDIRRRILTAFETAENTEDAAIGRRLLTFVVIGGGPTGVELAGAVAELARRALAKDFRNIDPGSARVLLVEAGPRLLPAFPPALSTRATQALEKLGVETRLGGAVTACDDRGVNIGGERIDADTIIWAAGVMASPAAKWLAAEKDKAGRVRVASDLSVPGHRNIFVIGDTALSVDRDDKPVPGIAPAAKQQGKYVSRLIRAQLDGRSPPGPFKYRHLGNLATIGRRAAVADFGWIKLSGALAWLLWGVVHVFFLIGFRNRVAVLLDWLWSYATFQRGSRLITGSQP